MGVIRQDGRRCTLAGRGWWWSWVGCVGFFALIAARVSAQEADETQKNIRVLQQKTLIRYHRVEVVPTFTLALNETLTRHLGVGGQVRYHITDEWAAGAEYIEYFGSDSALATDISAFGVAKETRYMNQYFGAHAAWTPLQAKFLFFGKGPIHWDFGLTAGLGATRTGASAYRVTGHLGGGFRFLLWRCLTLNLEVRDFMFMEKYRAGSEFVNNVVFTTGIGVLVPFTYHYEYPK